VDVGRVAPEDVLSVLVDAGGGVTVGIPMQAMIATRTVNHNLRHRGKWHQWTVHGPMMASRS
jgi:hypothetical protein